MDDEQETEVLDENEPPEEHSQPKPKQPNVKPIAAPRCSLRDIAPPMQRCSRRLMPRLTAEAKVPSRQRQSGSSAEWPRMPCTMRAP